MYISLFHHSFLFHLMQIFLGKEKRCRADIYRKSILCQCSKNYFANHDGCWIKFYGEKNYYVSWGLILNLNFSKKNYKDKQGLIYLFSLKYRASCFNSNRDFFVPNFKIMKKRQYLMHQYVLNQFFQTKCPFLLQNIFQNYVNKAFSTVNTFFHTP